MNVARSPKRCFTSAGSSTFAIAIAAPAASVPRNSSATDGSGRSARLAAQHEHRADERALDAEARGQPRAERRDQAEREQRRRRRAGRRRCPTARGRARRSRISGPTIVSAERRLSETSTIASSSAIRRRATVAGGRVVRVACERARRQCGGAHAARCAGQRGRAQRVACRCGARSRRRSSSTIASRRRRSARRSPPQSNAVRASPSQMTTAKNDGSRRSPRPGRGRSRSPMSGGPLISERTSIATSARPMKPGDRCEEQCAVSSAQLLPTSPRCPPTLVRDSHACA